MRNCINMHTARRGCATGLSFLQQGDAAVGAAAAVAARARQHAPAVERGAADRAAVGLPLADAVRQLLESHTTSCFISISRCFNVRQGDSSPWTPLLHSLPGRVNTPLLWSKAQLVELLRGSPVADAARQRVASLRQEWGAIAAAAPDLPAGKSC